MISNYYLLPEFTPARLQDLVLWYEPTSFRGNTWYNLAPCYSDRNHGKAHGGIGLSTWHPQFAPAPTFYGDDEYVEVPDNESLDITDEITVEMRIKINEDRDASDYICRKAGQYGLTFYGANGLRSFLVGETNGWTGFIYNSVLTTGLWYHIVQTFQGQATGINKVRLYLNGDLDRTYDFEDTLKTTINPFEISCSIADNQLKGFVGEARIYKSALPPAEVMHNYTHHPLYYIERGIDPYEFTRKRKFYFL